MTRIDHPEPLKRLAVQLRRLPGIGPRGAERIALWLLGGQDRTRPTELATVLRQAAETVHPCPECGFLTDAAKCAICEDESRATGPLCVVEESTDILPLERTGAFRGRYHALGGRLAPLDHVGPESLRIPGLLNRCRVTPGPAEIILALSADVEGEATAHYLAELLRAEFPHLPITRIAQGLPAGGGLESADELTLSRALSGRITMA
jgi:recombination protein RecR